MKLIRECWWCWTPVLLGVLLTFWGLATAQNPPSFAEVMAKMKAAKPEIAKKHLDLLEKRYDLANRPAPEISVIGNTDSVGTTQYNDELSLQRAEHVRSVFIERGIPEASISAAGRGKRELLVPTADGVAEPQNRRVEINVR